MPLRATVSASGPPRLPRCGASLMHRFARQADGHQMRSGDIFALPNIFLFWYTLRYTCYFSSIGGAVTCGSVTGGVIAPLIGVG